MFSTPKNMFASVSTSSTVRFRFRFFPMPAKASCFMQMDANTSSATQMQMMQPVKVSHQRSMSISSIPYTIRQIISVKKPHMNALPRASTCRSSYSSLLNTMPNTPSFCPEHNTGPT